MYEILQVQLLVSVKDIENYKKIRKNLEKLKLLVEEAELWVQKLPRSGEGGGGGERKVRWGRGEKRGGD